MNIGVEVEGRFKGLRTIFIRPDEFLTFYQKAFESAAEIEHVEQVRIEDLQNTLVLESTKLRHIASRYLVTVERTSLQDRPPEHVHVILRIESLPFWFIKATDQIKFEWQNLVFMCAAEQMVVTRAEDYGGHYRMQ